MAERSHRLIGVALEKKSKQEGKLKHFFVTSKELRERVLRPSAVWGVMTSLIATEFDNERGRAKILAISHLDYKRYFNLYERSLLDKISKAMKE